VLVDALLLIAVGLVSGYASGLFGIGGGLLRIPIFLHMLPVLGVPVALGMHVAAGTSLAVAVPTSIAASRSQQKAGNLDRGMLWIWLPPLGVGVVLGIVATRFVSGRVLAGLFAAVVLVAAIRMLVPRAETDANNTDDKSQAQLPSRPVLSILSLLIGVLSPMVGIVGGTFATPLLTALRYPIHRAVAVSSVGGLVVSVLGTIGFVATGWHAVGLPARFWGYVDPLALLLMTPCVLVTVPLGVWTANRLGARTLELLFGLVLVVMALDVAWRVVFWHGG
jgi:uncharacterized membrane protein YfcA